MAHLSAYCTNLVPSAIKTKISANPTNALLHSLTPAEIIPATKRCSNYSIYIVIYQISTGHQQKWAILRNINTSTNSLFDSLTPLEIISERKNEAFGALNIDQSKEKKKNSGKNFDDDWCGWRGWWKMINIYGVSFHFGQDEPTLCWWKIEAKCAFAPICGHLWR